MAQRIWLSSLLLSLPAFFLLGVFLFDGQAGVVSVLLMGGGLLIYMAVVAMALIESLARPLQTLANVVSALSEDDYSFRARGAAAGDAQGELAREINALSDLLQRQRVQGLEATALLGRILEVMQAPLFAFDRGERLQLVNHAGLRLLDRPRARCMGRSAVELHLDDLLAAPNQAIRSFNTAPARWLVHKSGFRQAGVPHMLLILSDVSVPLQHEEQAAWKRLIRVLGHELSNSLAPIKSIAGSLLARVGDVGGDPDMVSDLRRGLGVIEGRADALHRFVESYRQLAQLPAPRLQPVALAALMDRVVLLEQRLSVRLDAGPPVVLGADPDQLEQMLINLLNNAVDASLANAGDLVRITWTSEGEAVRIAIEDCGAGIANPDNLFVPFYTTKPSGSGIGLVLAQQIARAHGGEISLANREDGVGACAIIRLSSSAGM